MRSDDLRLHITSLAAVFLALGIGIFIGTAFVGAPVVERQMRGLNRTLNTKLDELGRRTEEAEKNEEALRALLPGLVGRKLAGRNVLVIRLGDYPDAARAAEESLVLAGAHVAVLDLPGEAWRRRAEEAGVAAASAFDDDENSDVNAGGDTLARDLDVVLAALTTGPNSGGAGAQTNAVAGLRRGGLLGGDLPAVAPPRLVVLVGGTTAPPDVPNRGTPAAPAPPSPREQKQQAEASARADIVDALHRRLIERLRAAGATVVGAEPLGADVSSLRAGREADIATVDNVDRAAGQIALTFALLGETAAYGIKPGAERVLPASLARAPSDDLAPPPAAAATSAAVPEAAPARGKTETLP